MIFDSHIHTMASPDSDMNPETAIDIMSKKNLGCIFTEHIDYNPLGEPFFSVDFNVYPDDYIKYKTDTVRLGLELNLIPECIEQNRCHAAHDALDYVIGSIHWVDGWDLFLAEEYYKQIGYKVYDRYLDYATEMIKTNDFFDALGHIDYISRYSPLPDKIVRYEKYSEAYDKLLITLIEREKLLEVNTKQFDDEEIRKNLFVIYSRYRELGGQYVTIGSDSHDEHRLGYKFDTALEMINKVGLTTVCFKERKMIECGISC